MLSFKDFLTVDYTPGMPEEISYAAMKRKRGRIGEDVDEALNFQQRRARARAMKKNKAKIAMGRRRAARKAADPKRLMKRARKAAINTLFKKLAKGQTRSDLPAGRRQEIEKRIEKMKPRVDKIARKMLPQIRKMEKERRMGGSDKK
ncbi:MAG: hypothetical protein VW270_21075 [Candidatus Poseidoniales archaeon]|jgi:hypothetical protein